MRILTIILGVLAVFGGFFCFLTPGATFLTLGWVAGVCLIASGISTIIYYIMNRKQDEASIWVLLGGIASLIMGFMITANGAFYLLAELFIIYSFATWITLLGLAQIGFSFTQKRNGEKWIGLLIMAIITLIIGVFSFMRPLFTAVTIGMMLGFWATTQGFNLIFFALSAKKTEKF